LSVVIFLYEPLWSPTLESNAPSRMGHPTADGENAGPSAPLKYASLRMTGHFLM
jgi:hypothetical protein